MLGRWTHSHSWMTDRLIDRLLDCVSPDLNRATSWSRTTPLWAPLTSWTATLHCTAQCWQETWTQRTSCWRPEPVWRPRTSRWSPAHPAATAAAPWGPDGHRVSSPLHPPLPPPQGHTPLDLAHHVNSPLLVHLLEHALQERLRSSSRCQRLVNRYRVKTHHTPPPTSVNFPLPPTWPDLTWPDSAHPPQVFLHFVMCTAVFGGVAGIVDMDTESWLLKGIMLVCVVGVTNAVVRWGARITSCCLWGSPALDQIRLEVQEEVKSVWGVGGAELESGEYWSHINIRYQ